MKVTDRTKTIIVEPDLHTALKAQAAIEGCSMESLTHEILLRDDNVKAWYNRPHIPETLNEAEKILRKDLGLKKS